MSSLPIDQCKKGSNCPLQHISSKTPTRVPGQMRAPYKLKDCLFFAQGRCAKGDKCTFRHNEPVGGAQGAAAGFLYSQYNTTAAAATAAGPASQHAVAGHVIANAARFSQYTQPVDFSELHMHASQEGTIAGAPVTAASSAPAATPSAHNSSGNGSASNSSAEGEPGAAAAPVAPSAAGGWSA